MQTLRTSAKCARKLFFIDALVTEDLLHSYRDAISHRNSQLISIEKNTDRSSLAAQTKRLHDLSVNWHTICKDLVDLEEQVRHLREVEAANTTNFGATFHGAAVDSCRQSLCQLESRCRFYCRWAMTYRDRTTGRINLVSRASFYYAKCSNVGIY